MSIICSCMSTIFRWQDSAWKAWVSCQSGMKCWDPGWEWTYLVYGNNLNCCGLKSPSVPSLFIYTCYTSCQEAESSSLFSWNWAEFVIGFVQYNGRVLMVCQCHYAFRGGRTSTFSWEPAIIIRSPTTLRQSRCEQTQTCHMERTNRGNMMILSQAFRTVLPRQQSYEWRSHLGLTSYKTWYGEKKLPGLVQSRWWIHEKQHVVFW